jgi:hypothetical protein
VAIREKALGPDNPKLANALYNLATPRSVDDRDVIDALED